MSFRAWLSVVTFILIGVIIFFARHELAHAWELLERVNIWILLLLIPGQLLVYFASGEMMFSYLRAKKSIEKASPLSLARMSLEMNFVNHILPSGGVSGISYMGWRLGHLGVSSGRAIMAQMVRFAMGFVAFIVLLIIAVIVVTIDGNINRWIILVSSALAGLMIGAIIVGSFLLTSPNRVLAFASWLTKTANRLVKKVTFGHVKNILVYDKVEAFFIELQHDYAALMRDKRVLIKPFLWGIVFTLADVSLFCITFWALGEPVNPAPILIAYGVATSAGFFVVTPGGAGAYETLMVAFLKIAGIAAGAAIAGIVLTRVFVLLGTIGLGYLFYQHALIRYGKHKRPTL
jgi:putative heme transporter